MSGMRGELRKGAQGGRKFAPHGKSILRQLDRRLEQFGPGQASIFLVRHVEHRDDAGHAGRQTAGNGIEMSARLAARIQEHAGGGRSRSRLAAIEARDLPGPGIVDHHEVATADARRFRFDQGQDQLRRDGRIHGRTAFAHHLASGLSGIGIGCRDHMVLGDGFRRASGMADASARVTI